MFIRFVISADDSPIGRIALSYLPALIRLAPVRLMDPRVPIFALQGAWERYSRCLTTPMDGDFVNVVCVAPERWAWTQRMAAPVRNRHIALAEDGDPEQVETEATEEISGVVELYTAVGPRTKCLRNVLIHDLSADAFAALPEELRATAIRYEKILGPTWAADPAALRGAIRGLT